MVRGELLMSFLKTTAAAARLKQCTRESRQWLRTETLKLAENELHRQQELHRAGLSSARDRIQVLERAIDLLNILEV